jgi:hypothetical protein
MPIATSFVMLHPPLPTTPAAPGPILVATWPVVEAPLVNPVSAPPILIPIAVRKSIDVATINTDLVRFKNPGFVFGVYSQGSPRTAFNLPILISPTATATDQTLFEEPLDPTKIHYLPRYGIAVTAGPAGPAKWVCLEPVGQQFQLTVHLADVTDPAIVASNIRQDATTRYLLTANLQGRVVNWDLVPSAADGAALKLTLVIPPLSEGLPDLDGRAALYYAMTEPDANASLIIRRTLDLAVPAAAGANGEALFTQTNVTIDSSRAFLFNKDLDSNVFSQLTGVGPGLPPFLKEEVIWKGSSHRYYYDRGHPERIYFFPDAFKVTRQPDPPHAPSLIVSTNGQDSDALTLTLSYIASPVWDPQRIDDAVTQLRQRLILTQAPEAAPLEASETTLLLKLPSADPNSPRVLQAQPDAIIHLAEGIKGSVTLNLEQFKYVYDALFDDVSDLLSGEVDVNVGTDVEKISFIARASEFAGDIFDTKTFVDPQSNHVTILQNAIESPIHVDSLVGFLTNRDNTIVNCVEETSTSLPVDLPAGSAGPPATAAGSLSVTLHPAPGTQVDSAATVLFDFSQTRVLPDPKAIWRAIARNQVVGPVSREITVHLYAFVLTPASGTPAPDALLAVQVAFENGQTASFDSSQVVPGEVFLTHKVALAMPVENYVLGEGDNENFQYRVILITPSGNKTGNPVTTNLNEFYVSVN